MKRTLTIVLLVITAFAFRPSEKKVSIFLVGDSTMADQPTDENPQRGWGQLFPKYFTDEVEIKNFAKNGRSTKSFITEGRWDSVLNQLQPGDWVFLQFGHNDSKIEDTTRYAAPQTTYKTNLTRFINEARSKGAIPVLITPVNRRKFDADGKFVDQHGEYPGVVRALAQQLKVTLIDLHKSSQTLLEQKGVEGSKNLFLFIPENHFKKYKGKEEDNTHFTEYGAESVASLVCADIKKQNLAIAKYLKPSDFKEKDAFELPKIYVPHFKLDTFYVTNYGAKADGVTLNTKAINDAIADANTKGGGTVVIPRGLWSTGPIVMKSNVNLHLDAGALVAFTNDFTQYPLVKSDFEGVAAARCQSPITAENLTNIAITGKGVFDGNGAAWRPIKKSKMIDADWKRLVTKGVVSDDKTWFPSAKALKGYNDKNIGKLDGGKQLSDFEDIKDFLRPNFFRIALCKNVLLDDITVQNSPAWNLHILIDEDVTVHNVKVKNPWNAQNTDAIDIESSKNVRLEGCIFDTGDDGICIKSGRDEEGRKRGIPTENVIVDNCIVYHAHGGFVVGSEMSGGAKNLYVSNTTFMGTDVGLRFKSTRGRGGVVENIYANNINMKDILGDAIFFDVYYQAKDPVPSSTADAGPPPAIEMKPVDEGTPLFQNFFIRNITCDGADDGIYLRGLPEMNIKNVVIENAVLQATKGIYCEEASGITFKNIDLISDNTNPVIFIQNSNTICLDDIKYKPDADLLLSINGDRTKNIRLLNTDISKAKKQTQFANNTNAKVLTNK
ncbi:glycosyl hydrolase family 28 protein [Ferruginibacter albus]|uniref:glycosyl hydrolase family 28 protein n=1 Tax=Ferruginibacter albus TaxID=2875540 RepID=UPI001CC5C95C|nr:glycosyl hydrolase family 28 protein [Ferruginibacter albus]UAY53658.1 GDSL family lipase [Ferruginibacter albus]